MPVKPIVNITMPVFNRRHATQKAILALRRTSQAIPFTLTVVDNGSDPELAQKLVEFREDGIIDHLYLLPENMGISCAANIGWQMTDAPYYMKLDNDTVIKESDWLPKLFALWRHGEALSNLGGAYSEKMLLAAPGTMHTPDGVLGRCATNLPGQAILVPKAVSDVLGLWNEDYGLYGAEDGDYGARMNCVGFPQYFYLGPEIFDDLGRTDSDETYTARNVNKEREHRTLFTAEDGGMGLFRVNYMFYDFCIRSWKTPLRYKIVDIYDKYHVRVATREEYIPVMQALRECKRITDQLYREGLKKYTHEHTAKFKEIMADCGQGCTAIAAPAPEHTQ
ncbi:MAG: glycosyltransferase [Deltaproteobacteria bacterium]|jgi:glycosyltransferase involved in cell wall biosynthesis|nr:glycosyltransferase [Deltaproteobacteria bacterium]